METLLEIRKPVNVEQPFKPPREENPDYREYKVSWDGNLLHVETNRFYVQNVPVGGSMDKKYIVPSTDIITETTEQRFQYSFLDPRDISEAKGDLGKLVEVVEFNGQKEPIGSLVLPSTGGQAYVVDGTLSSDNPETLRVHVALGYNEVNDLRQCLLTSAREEERRFTDGEAFSLASFAKILEYSRRRPNNFGIPHRE